MSSGKWLLYRRSKREIQALEGTGHLDVQWVYHSMLSHRDSMVVL